MSAAPWIACKGAFIKDPPYGKPSTAADKLIGTKLSFKMNHASILFDHDSRNHVRRYASERCLSECVIERHSGLAHGVMV
ncbi:hypothetical protein TNCV_1982611 [Trichonephila clavipes]|nr:hypothetical protein TNCV_1982611 [Trichonephila clavipes]